MTVHVPLEQLESWTASALAAHGVPEERARMAAEALCYADAVGMDTHGVANLDRIYVPGLRNGAIDPTAEPAVVSSRGATELWDARDGLGLWVAVEAVDRAVTMAREHGVGAVGVRGSTHLGPIGAYVERAALAGCAAIAFSNCGGQRIAPSPLGGAPVLGTNPLGIAVPGGTRPPFVLDMSTTVVPTGRVRRAAALGETLPEGILADDDGRPVTDPAAFDAGDANLLWLGGRPETGAFKGFGLGLAVDLLGGLLTGAGVGPLAALGGGDRDIGQLFVAIDMAAFGDPAAQAGRFDALAAALAAAAGVEGDVHPGSREARTRDERRRTGVPLDDDLAARLSELAGSGSAV